MKIAHAVPTALQQPGQILVRCHSRDSAMREFKRRRMERAEVFQRNVQVEVWTRGPLGGIQIEKVSHDQH